MLWNNVIQNEGEGSSSLGMGFYKPIIGILASDYSKSGNRTLIDALNYLVSTYPETLKKFQFVTTLDTYQCIMPEDGLENSEALEGVTEQTQSYLIHDCGILKLPPQDHGGIVFMIDLIVKRTMNIVWHFLSPDIQHDPALEHAALHRLSILCGTTRLVNDSSVFQWAYSALSINNTKPYPPIDLGFRIGGVTYKEDDPIDMKHDHDGSVSIDWNKVNMKDKMSVGKRGKTISLMAHDKKKDRLEAFVIDHQNELRQFERIICTGTSGGVVQKAIPRLQHKVRCYNSGPKGGDMEISVEMIFKRCDILIFFIDSQSPHPHSDDVKVFLNIARKNGVYVMESEQEARIWMFTTAGRLADHTPYTKWLEEQSCPAMLNYSDYTEWLKEWKPSSLSLG